MEKVDPKFLRFNLDEMMSKADALVAGNTQPAYEIIDELYVEGRKAVDAEIDQVDDLFLRYAAKEGRGANEIELTNLLYDREKWETLATKQKEIEEAKEAAKIDRIE